VHFPAPQGQARDRPRYAQGQTGPPSLPRLSWRPTATEPPLWTAGSQEGSIRALDSNLLRLEPDLGLYSSLEIAFLTVIRCCGSQKGLRSV
jgi:hypothetical protein